MQVFLNVINVLLILNAIILIVSVLMQEGSRQGLGTIAGGAETFFGKSKGKSYEGKLEWITKISVTTFIIFTVTMTAINARNTTSSVTPADLTDAPSVSEILDEKRMLQGDGLDTQLPTEETNEADAAVTEGESVIGESAAATAEPTAEPAVEPTAAPTAEPITEATEAPAA